MPKVKGQLPEPVERDPGLQPERTALSWRRTVLSAVVADLLIWRGWFKALSVESSREAPGLFGTDVSAHAMGLGICAIVACLTTIVLVVCAVHRIKILHAGTAALGTEADIAVSALTLRTASAAIVALAAAAVVALALGI